MKTTPLNATHREAGARMVDFGGWDMPLHYGSQLDEHHAVRRDAGIFDVSHMRVVDLTGPDTRAFLRYALANNVDKLAIPGKALYTCMLAEDGGVRDDLIVYFLNDYHFRLVVNAATADTDVAWLEALRDRTGPGVSIRPRTDLAILAVQGPNARAKAWQALPGTESATAGLKPFSAASAGDLFVARTGYTGEDGFEIVVPASHVVDAWNALVAAGVKPAGLGARDTLRLEAGMNLYGQDMDERVSPLDAGLAWTVDLESPRDFVGKDALVAQPATRQLAGLVLLDAGGVLRAHQKVRTAHGDGEITSGTFGPTIARSIALARLPLDVAVGDVVDVEVRDKTLRARVAKPPFVRHGQVKVDVG
jgi:aminomethyltransferase